MTDAAHTIPADTSEGETRQLLSMRLPPDLVQLIINELAQRRGSNISEYSDDEIEEVATRASNGDIRTRVDITTSLLNLPDREGSSSTDDSSRTTYHTVEENSTDRNSAQEESSIQGGSATIGTVYEDISEEDERQGEVGNYIDGGLHQTSWNLPGTYATPTIIATPWADRSERLNQAGIQLGEDLEAYGSRMQSLGHNDIFQDGRELIFRSTFTNRGVRGVGWIDENHYESRAGYVHDTRAAPPGDCFNCGGNHWRKHCPYGRRR